MSGIINSVNTNTGAMIALDSLDETNQALAVTQKQVSTGFRVADASDDGAAFAIATTVRSTVGALNSANQQLGASQGLLSTTNSALTNIATTMGSMRDTLVKLADSSLSVSERTQDQAQYTSLANQVQSYIQDAAYNGQTLIGNITGSTGSFGSVNIARNEAGASYTIATAGGSEIYNSLISGSLAGTSTTPMTATSAKATLVVGTNTDGGAAGTPGLFIRTLNVVETSLNTVGTEINYVNNQVSYNNNKIDALNTGLGSMVDADLAKESAQLTALQIRQQLGTQALSLANQAPQSLLSLFK
jgi:flagellin